MYNGDIFLIFFDDQSMNIEEQKEKEEESLRIVKPNPNSKCIKYSESKLSLDLDEFLDFYVTLNFN